MGLLWAGRGGDSGVSLHALGGSAGLVSLDHLASGPIARVLQHVGQILPDNSTSPTHTLCKLKVPLGVHCPESADLRVLGANVDSGDNCAVLLHLEWDRLFFQTEVRQLHTWRSIWRF